MTLSSATTNRSLFQLASQHLALLLLQPSLQLGFPFQLACDVACYFGIHLFLLIDHLVVQRSLPFGVLLFPDLLRERRWEVLADDLVAVLVALVVFGDFFILQLVGQRAILPN